MQRLTVSLQNVEILSRMTMVICKHHSVMGQRLYFTFVLNEKSCTFFVNSSFFVKSRIYITEVCRGPHDYHRYYYVAVKECALGGSDLICLNLSLKVILNFLVHVACDFLIVSEVCLSLQSVKKFKRVDFIFKYFFISFASMSIKSVGKSGF